MIDHTIVLKLNPSIVSIRGEVAYDVNGNEVAYDKDAVQAYINANEYKSKRGTEYPPIGDQLDALFKAGAFPADMAAKIQAVKDKYPKA